MSSGPRRLAGPLAAALLAASVGAATGGEEPPAGRALFQGHRPFAAGRSATANHLPPEFAACAGCHGAGGDGRREGGTAAPPIGLPVLLRPRGEEAAYDSPEAVRTAILHGAGRGGRTLNTAMPRFRLTDDEMSALLGYLGVVGTAADHPPGVADKVVVLGTVLPLSGPALATGQAVLSGLRAALAEADAGVHDRRLSLAVEDAAANGTAAAIRRLLLRPVYAVVGGLWSRDPDVDSLLAQARVPSIGSLVQHVEDAATPGGWTADLLAPAAVQAKALAAVLRACDRPGPRLALEIAGQTPAAPRASDDRPDPSTVRWLADPASLTAALRDAGASGCLGTGLAGARHVAGELPPGWRRFAVLPFPAELIADPGSGDRRDPWRALGRAAGRLAVETLARAGPALTERSVLMHLPSQSAGFIPVEGVTPVRFGPRRSYGWDPAIVELAAPPRPGAAPARDAETGDDDNPGG